MTTRATHPRARYLSLAVPMLVVVIGAALVADYNDWDIIPLIMIGVRVAVFVPILLRVPKRPRG